jgi:hypothetical protein
MGIPAATCCAAAVAKFFTFVKKLGASWRARSGCGACCWYWLSGVALPGPFSNACKSPIVGTGDFTGIA